MKIGVLIYEGPYNHQASDSAYNFIKAAMDKGHEIIRVFFYHDGVINVTKLMEPPSDDRHIAKRWSEIGEKGVDVIACIAAAKRRGMVDDILTPNTRISGLGQLVEMGVDADKVVVFGD